jgi:hypothetical protein
MELGPFPGSLFQALPLDHPDYLGWNLWDLPLFAWAERTVNLAYGPPKADNGEVNLILDNW